MVDKAVKFPAPKVKVPAFVIAPDTLILPAPCVKVPLFVNELSAVKLNVLVLNVYVAGKVNALVTVVFPVNVFVPVPENVSVLYVVPFIPWLAPE